MPIIYHITTPEMWEKCLMENKALEPASLEDEGFAHCSTEEQLLGSLNKHFTEHREVVVLHIISKRVNQCLKWEPSRGGELFPHIYSRIPLHAVEHTQIYENKGNGEWEIF